MPADATSPCLPAPLSAATGESLRIALVCDWYLPRIGGIERQLACLADVLVNAGHQVTVITPMPGAKPGPRIALQHIPTPLVPGATLMWAPRGFRALGDVLRNGRFDIVHVHSSTLSPAAFGAIFHAQHLGLPTVATMHSIPGRLRPMFVWLHRRFRWGDWPVVYSAVSHRVTRELQPLVSRPMAILPNAIDPDFWRPSARKAGTDALTIACVMRLVPRKRGDVLLDAFNAVCGGARHRQLTLHFIGDGPSRRGLERRARSLGCSAKVQFHGSLAPDAIRDVLHQSDLFALPCPVEAFGIAALEARATGLPVLAMAETGVREFIAHGRDGLLARDEADFGAALRMLCTDDQLRQRIAEHNRGSTIACTWKRSLELHLSTYAEARRRALAA